ncbi:MAG TPA: M48 family metallopeptidase [Terriglobia bacterium]|nr:M48 family metallopeptidase [Terriglobia bacterium]
MKLSFKGSVAIILSELLVLMPACSHPPKVGAPAPAPPQGIEPLSRELRKPYLELFKISSELQFSNSEIRQMSQYLQKGEDYCVGQFKARAHKLASEVSQAKKQLNRNSGSNGEEHAQRCKIQNLELLESQAKVLYQHAIPVAYENRQAKLELIQNWPSDLKTIKEEIANGSYRNRRWGDVKDIGFRTIVPGQKDDIPLGQEEVRQMKSSGMLPPEVKDQEIDDYVNSVAQNVARHSDLQIPLHVTVLNSKEINAFALPGGYLFVERGLLQAADNESELAGVIGHEIGHVVARHGHQLMRQATIASIFYQAAQVAALVLTGGVAGIGTYYALQYGFYGLGMLLSLKMLGVSREFELQADQLGIQYAWNSDYDPQGFIKFFDKMATKEGYVNGVSWFHTHPPFYTRMVDAEREIMFLPKKEHYIVNTKAFMEMKKELKKVSAEANRREKNAPTLELTKNVKGCAPPRKFEFKPDEPIETLCQSPNLVTGEKSGETAPEIQSGSPE